MTAPEATPNPSTPRHLWVIGVIALLWNCVGAWDYYMTETQNAAYLKAFTPEQLVYFYALPAWAVSAWAIGVWGGVLGTLLLLFRKRLAIWVYLASILGVVGTNVYNYVLTDGMRVMGGAGALVFSSVIFLVALGLLLYARAMGRRGILT